MLVSKIISQITSPSYGIIKAKGRIASLLEVGTVIGKIYMNNITELRACINFMILELELLFGGTKLIPLEF